MLVSATRRSTKLRSLSDADTPFKESVQALLADSPCD